MRPSRSALVVGASPQRLTRALEERGFRVEATRDAQEAIEQYQRKSFDVCIVLAETKSSAELGAKLRMLPPKRVVPIVVVNANPGEKGNFEDVDKIQADAFVSDTDPGVIVEAVERTIGKIGGVVPAPEDDEAVEKVFALVRSIGKKSSSARSTSKEKKKLQSDRNRTLQQLIESVERRLLSEPEISREDNPAIEEEGLDALDVEAEIEPFVLDIAEKEPGQKDLGVAREGADDGDLLAKIFFAPLYGILGCSYDADKEELAEAYAVRSECLRNLRRQVEKREGSDEVHVLKNAQKSLDLAFDVLSKKATQNYVKRCMLEKREIKY